MVICTFVNFVPWIGKKPSHLEVLHFLCAFMVTQLLNVLPWSSSWSHLTNCARPTENFHSRIRGRSQNLQTSNIPHDGDYLFLNKSKLQWPCKLPIQPILASFLRSKRHPSTYLPPPATHPPPPLSPLTQLHLTLGNDSTSSWHILSCPAFADSAF